MIKLTFENYMKKKSEEKKVVIQSEHYFENENLFMLFFKSRERWEYYTIVMKQDINDFDELSIEDFKLNYCYNVLEVLESPIFIQEEYKELEYEPSLKESINKKIDFDKLAKESKTYADFLIKMFDKFESEVLKSVNKINLVNKRLNKNFGDFISDLFNVVNTKQFANKIKKFLIADVKQGKAVAEKELNMKIPYNKAFEQKTAKLYQEQINGYTINGKKWFGIKGVTKEIQQKVISTVQDGISKNKSLDEISKDVKGTFDKFTDWRSEMIARTESSRISNESQLLGYQESGLDGVKVWVTAPYEKGRSTDICQRLKGQEQPLDSPFIDSVTNRAFMTPPALPNCRSRISFRPF